VPPVTTLETVLRRDRVVVTAGLVGVAALGWIYLLYLARDMSGMGMSADMAMPQMQTWGAVDLALLFVMWAVMMVAMMVPSASPLILVVAAANRKRRERDDPLVPTGLFFVGYLLAWTAFSGVATVAQWGLHTTALLSPAMVGTSPVLGGLLLLAAGVFQFTSLKQVCLTHCRSPLGFVMGHWREGRGGALRMGLEHGLYCVGCCWILMALLFVAGVMNLFWVALISLFVLAEKVFPKGELVGRIGGAALVVAGVVMLTSAV
jgi:predicted metal-binding membrane protein|tara:strand:+ start:1302 stop:2087 length:786 start_codon:yes stop_codon:yes gene_type:complete